jgi:hypothetical protein
MEVRFQIRFSQRRRDTKEYGISLLAREDRGRELGRSETRSVCGRAGSCTRATRAGLRGMRGMEHMSRPIQPHLPFSSLDHMSSLKVQWRGGGGRGRSGRACRRPGSS